MTNPTKTKVLEEAHGLQRALTNKIDALEKAYKAGRKKLEDERAGVEAAIAALNGRKPGERKRRNRHRRQTSEAYGVQILDHLRENPRAHWTPTELTEALDQPPNSTRKAVRLLVDTGRVNHVDQTPRGLPIIQHKAITVPSPDGGAVDNTAGAQR